MVGGSSELDLICRKSLIADSCGRCKHFGARFPQEWLPSEEVFCVRAQVDFGVGKDEFVDSKTKFERNAKERWCSHRIEGHKQVLDALAAM